MDPLVATGLLVYSDPPGPISLLGTCAAYKRTNIVLTAAHCVRHVPKPGRIRVEFPRLGMFHRVLALHLHPTADLAVVVSPDEEEDRKIPPWEPFRVAVDDWSLGEEFYAYGFPTEGPNISAEPGLPTPRVFRGHYQRYFSFTGGRYSYLAGELSIPAPEGLSGGPVFRGNGFGQLTGIVAGSVEAYSILSHHEEVREGGVTRVEEHHRRIEYGVSVILSEVDAWLGEILAESPGGHG